MYVSFYGNVYVTFTINCEKRGIAWIVESRVIFISKGVLQVVRRSFMNEYIYEIERERERDMYVYVYNAYRV